MARFEIPDAKHAMLDRPRLWRRLAISSALGLVGAGPLPPAVAAALELSADSALDDLSADLTTAEV